MIKEARKKLSVLESSPTSLSILAKNTCNIFQTKQIGNKKVQNNGCSNAYFWVNLPWIIPSAKFKMVGGSNNSLNLVHSNAHARPWHCSFSLACYFSFAIVSLEKECGMGVAINWFSKLKMIWTNFCICVHLKSFTAKLSAPRRKLPWVLEDQRWTCGFPPKKLVWSFTTYL